MADVRREKELAEKRKNEPQLDEQRDQLVRKIFTKFRKDRAPSTVLGMQQQQPQQQQQGASDEGRNEAGDGVGGSSSGTTADGRPKVLPLQPSRQHSEDQQATCSRQTTMAAAPKKVSKWGKVLGSGGGGGAGSTESMDTSVVSLQSAPAKIRDSPGRSSGNGHKVFPKLQKVPTTTPEPFIGGGGQRQETINETDERSNRAPGGGVGGGSEPEEEPPPVRQRLEAPSPPPPPCPVTLLPPPPPDLDALSSRIDDLKADLKADVVSIDRRLTAIEDTMRRIVDKLDALSLASVAAAAVSPLPLRPPGTPDTCRGCRTKSTDDLSAPATPKLPPMARRRRSKSRTRSTSSALPLMRPYSPRDTSPPPPPRSESLKKPCPPRPNDFL